MTQAALTTSPKVTIAPIIAWGELLRVLLVAAPIFTATFISATALIYLGVDYVSPTGSVPLKVHPATYLACICVLVLLAFGPGKRMFSIVFSTSGLWLYFVGLVILFAYAAAFLSVPFMFLIDTFLYPGLVFVLIATLSTAGNRLLARLFDIFMVLNSLLGIYEVRTDWRLVPITGWSSTLGQWVYPHEWRATAFLGHPLANGFITGAYVLSLMITRRIESLPVRYSLLAVHGLALFAFGSRTAIGVLALFVVIYCLKECVSAFTTGRIRRDMLIFACALIPLIVLVFPLLLASGFADRFIDRFVNDNGSAEARSLMLELIGNFDLSDLVTGPPAQTTFQILKRYNIIAVESFWINFLLLFGFVGWAIFAPALFRICRCTVRYGGRGSAFVLLYFFILISGAVGLASKTTMFATILVICLTNEGMGYQVPGGRRSFRGPLRAVPAVPPLDGAVR